MKIKVAVVEINVLDAREGIRRCSTPESLAGLRRDLCVGDIVDLGGTNKRVSIAHISAADGDVAIACSLTRKFTLLRGKDGVWRAISVGPSPLRVGFKAYEEIGTVVLVNPAAIERVEFA